jgi:hypothetical protein
MTEPDAETCNVFEGKPIAHAGLRRERLIFITKIHNGFVPKLKEEIYERMRPLETPVCLFANLSEPKNARRGIALTAEVMKQCRWVKPELVARSGSRNGPTKIIFATRVSSANETTRIRAR